VRCGLRTEEGTGGMMMRMHAGWRSVCMVMALVAAFATFGQTPPPAENVIHVEISGLRSDKGQMLCALYSSAEAFPKKADKAVARFAPKISPRQTVCDLTGVPPTPYCGPGWHDEKSKCKLHPQFTR